eukprot:3259472-Prymnesium_polylepis.3
MALEQLERIAAEELDAAATFPLKKRVGERLEEHSHARHHPHVERSERRVALERLNEFPPIDLGGAYVQRAKGATIV